jgi:hypothetical protein
MKRLHLIAVIVLALNLLLDGCGSDNPLQRGEPTTDDGNKPTAQVRFETVVKPILQQCTGCHADGAGDWTYDGGPQAYTQVLEVVDAADAANSSLLRKATNELTHSGGTLFDKDSGEYRSILAWIESGLSDTGPLANASSLSCTECHDGSSLITGKTTAWRESLHGTGEAYLRGTSRTCAGCHSGGAFQEMVVAGLNPGSVTAGDPEPTRQDCRTCHQLHTSNTVVDWALTTTDPVALFAFEDVTYDGGKGNLCATCHQPRRGVNEAVDGQIAITSTHWGPHHGPQSAMLLGIAGAGDVVGGPMVHYTGVEGTCVGCHMGKGANHRFEANVAACQGCHSGAENFDINGTQSEIQALLDELEEGLIGLGWLDEEGHPTVASIPEAQAAALWNWIYIAHEDKSGGVHNPAYTRALLQAGLAALDG